MLTCLANRNWYHLEGSASLITKPAGFCCKNSLTWKNVSFFNTTKKIEENCKIARKKNVREVEIKIKKNSLTLNVKPNNYLSSVNLFFLIH